MKKKENSTKSRIVSASWKLFYENGFDNTTIDDIVELSQTSKGSFYHYFKSKDSILGSLAYLFDEKYQQLEKEIDYSQNSIGILIFLTEEMYTMIENTIDVELLSHLYAQQLNISAQKEFLDHTRLYYKLLKKVIQTGQEKNEITKEKSASEIVRLYSILDRGLIYDWCLHNGSYSLKEYSTNAMKLFLSGLREQ